MIDLVFGLASYGAAIGCAVFCLIQAWRVT
jgi:hypothetical protein